MATKQAPIHSGFDAETTASEAIDTRRLDGLAVGDGPSLAERLWTKSEEWTGLRLSE